MKSRKRTLLDLIRLKIAYTSEREFILKVALSDLKSEEIQEQLRKIYIAKKRGKVKGIKCLCRKDKDVLVHIKKLERKKQNGTKPIYIIASNPNKKQDHSDDCLLGNKIQKYIDTENIKPKIKNLSIFEAPKQTQSKSILKKESKEKERKLTFSILMSLVLGHAYQFAFASKNKVKGQKISRCSRNFPAQMPTTEEVIKKFFRKFLDFFSQKGSSSFEKFKEKFTLEIGIVSYFKFKEHEQILEMEFHRYLPKESKGEILKIPKQRVSNIILSNKAISTSTAPLFLAVIRKRNNYEITRAYAYPILYEDIKKPFIPVDSTYEREFINEILERGIKIIKPIKNNLTWHLFFTNLDIYSYIIEYNYTPDLIVFNNSNEELIITEIVDRNLAKNQNYYKNNLEHKKKLCEKISEKISNKLNNCKISCLEAYEPKEIIEKIKNKQK